MTKRRKVGFAALCALAMAGGGGCGGDKREAASLATAVERYRLANDAQKGAAVVQLAIVKCSEPAVCEAKAACVTATSATAEGLALKAEVERLLADVVAKRLSPEDPAATALPGKLDDADRLLKAGHRDMKACDEKVIALKLKYGV